MPFKNNEPRGYETLLEPLLSAELILIGIAHGVLPVMTPGGYTQAQYTKIISMMGRSALDGNSARWLWREISKKHRAGKNQ